MVIELARVSCLFIQNAGVRCVRNIQRVGLIEIAGYIQSVRKGFRFIIIIKLYVCNIIIKSFYKYFN